MNGYMQPAQTENGKLYREPLMRRPVPLLRERLGLLIFCSILLLYSISAAADAGQIILRPYSKTVRLTGYTQPIKQITATSEITGRCLSVHADKGGIIGSNGVFARIDSTFIKLDLTANLLAREEAERQLAEEERTLARYVTLIEQKSTPQARLDEVRLAADLHRIAKKKLDNEKKRLEEKLERHTIKVPPGWTVIETSIEPGELVQSGQAIAQLGDFSRLLVPLSVTFQELQALSQTAELYIYLPDIEKRIQGRIYRSSPVFDPKTRKIEVEVEINASDPTLEGYQLRGGMRAELVIQTKTDTQSFEVPTSALIRRYDTYWLTKPAGDLVPVIVLGVTENGSSTIISGKQLRVGQHYLAAPVSSPTTTPSGK